MGYIEEVTKISGKQLMFCLVFVSGAVCPGLLAIWNFAPHMIENCSSFILILLSIAITLPIVSINTLVVGIATESILPKKAQFPDGAPASIAIGAFAAMLTMGFPILFAFLFDFIMSTFVWSVVGTEVLFCFIFTTLGLSWRKAAKSQETVK